jgi:UDP-N-acetylmuramate dehydrogenase
MIIEDNALITNSLGIKSTCKFLLTLENDSDLEELKLFLRNTKYKYYIVGEGTNLVLPNFYDGCIIQTKFTNIIEDNVNQTLKVGAAYNWTDLVHFCISNDINGFENLIDIPGSVGAAPIQNIGAYGAEVASLIKSIDCFCLKDYKKVSLNNAQCNFQYRNSSLKNAQLLICNINFVTDKKQEISINYQSIKNYLKNNIINISSNSDVANVVSTIRANTLPDPKIINNVGSFFKNPIVHLNSINFDQYSKDELIIWDYSPSQVKVGAARLIDLIKNDIPKYKNVSLYEKHALVLTTNGRATQDEIISFASDIQLLVFRTFNINLEIEPNIIF